MRSPYRNSISPCRNLAISQHRIATSPYRSLATSPHRHIAKSYRHIDIAISDRPIVISPYHIARSPYRPCTLMVAFLRYGVGTREATHMRPVRNYSALAFLCVPPCTDTFRNMSAKVRLCVFPFMLLGESCTPMHCSTLMLRDGCGS